jgi:hypothetical protein
MRTVSECVKLAGLEVFWLYPYILGPICAIIEGNKNTIMAEKFGSKKPVEAPSKHAQLGKQVERFARMQKNLRDLVTLSKAQMKKTEPSEAITEMEYGPKRDKHMAVVEAKRGKALRHLMNRVLSVNSDKAFYRAVAELEAIGEEEGREKRVAYLKGVLTRIRKARKEPYNFTKFRTLTDKWAELKGEDVEELRDRLLKAAEGMISRPGQRLDGEDGYTQSEVFAAWQRAIAPSFGLAATDKWMNTTLALYLITREMEQWHREKHLEGQEDTGVQILRGPITIEEE